MDPVEVLGHLQLRPEERISFFDKLLDTRSIAALSLPDSAPEEFFGGLISRNQTGIQLSLMGSSLLENAPYEMRWFYDSGGNFQRSERALNPGKGETFAQPPHEIQGDIFIREMR